MRELRVRSAADSDLAALIAIDPLAVPGSERWQALHEFSAEGRHEFLRAEKSEDARSTIAGYAVVVPEHFFGRDFIELVVVAESERRQGVATQLIDAALKSATTPTVFTSPNESNEGMRALLEAQGREVSGVLNGLDEGDPEIVFYLRMM